jgi:hypothetical protein
VVGAGKTRRPRRAAPPRSARRRPLSLHASGTHTAPV